MPIEGTTLVGIINKIVAANSILIDQEFLERLEKEAKGSDDADRRLLQTVGAFLSGYSSLTLAIMEALPAVQARLQKEQVADAIGRMEVSPSYAKHAWENTKKSMK